MKTVKGFPPNYQAIKEALNPPPNAIFAWGNKIYNPSGNKIPPDVMIHEEVHERQQALFGTVELWWAKYLLDGEFRFNSELQAYAKQYEWVKKFYPVKAQKVALTEFANNLISLYNYDMELAVAESKIRNYAVR